MALAYLEGARKILTENLSEYKPKRTGVDTISLFGDVVCAYGLAYGFPLLTTKKMPFKSVIHELLWFLRGDTNIKYLVDNNVHIWTDNAFQRYLRKTGKDKELLTYSAEWREARDFYIDRIKENPEFAKVNGDLGPIYGEQWRKWRTSDGRNYDQVQDVIDKLKNNPTSRRMVVASWNVRDLGDMEIPPCHALYIFNVGSDDRVNCQMTQRSADFLLGVPFNIASTASFASIVAYLTGRQVGRFIHVIADAHIYCGRGDRGKFYKEHLPEIKQKGSEVTERQGYLDVKDWIIKHAPQEEYVEDESQSLDHVTAVLEQLSREPMPLPQLEIRKMQSGEPKQLDELTIDDFKLTGYKSHPPIKRAMAV